MPPTLPYSLGDWDYERLGNHRAVLQVVHPSDAARVSIPWRRRDRAPKAVNIIITDEQGQAVENVARLGVTREQGELVFQPTAGAGRYYAYYLPYTGTTQAPYPQIQYCPPQDTADPAWRAAWEGQAESLPQAEVIEIQAVDAYHSFYPMQVIATRAETEALAAQYASEPFLVFPEDRAYPVRMRADLPQRWIERGPGQPMQARAGRGEFLAFQLGVWAFRGRLDHLGVNFHDLAPVDHSAIAGALRAPAIPSSSFRCWNLGGVDWTGAAFDKQVRVEAGEVQALWCGVQIPEDCQPGRYLTQVEVTADCAAPSRGECRQAVEIQIEVLPESIPAGGDDEPWRHSRLRWLDSTIALDDEVTKPFLPVTVRGDELAILGRSVTLAPDGLPGHIRSFFTPEVTAISATGREILARPARFEVTDGAGQRLDWQVRPYAITHISPQEQPGRAAWESHWRAGALTLALSGALEFDGTLEYTLALTATAPTSLSDICLEMPYHPAAARYMMGLGVVGGYRPESLHWTWDVARKNQDSAWLGDVNAGMQFTLKDETYSRPLNTNYYLLKPLRLPASWGNQGKGSVTITEEGGGAVSADGEVLARCSSGALEIQPGQTLYFNFRLAITPFKPLDTDAQWATRFYHRYHPLEQVIAEGANTINIHHATEINPFINYPFLATDGLKGYIDEAHRRDLRVKIYYTVRELTNHAPEIYALRSLGDEILSDGPGGGHSWLQEHLVDHYIPGWHVFALRDVAVINSGTSRWHNFYLEGLDWLARNVSLDGIYIDDLAFDRVVMKRMRKILDRRRPDALIDLHSANQFRERDGYANSANLYLEHFPYLDRLWFGEYFDYNLAPDFWLVEVSGIPFGLMGEMLQDGGNPWRGMLYGITPRLPHSGDPRPVWRIWNDFGMQGSRMVGYWSPTCPAHTDHPDVLATAYIKPGKTLIALASWAAEPVAVRLTIDWPALGLDPAHAVLRAAESEGFQPAARFEPGDMVTVEPGKGWLLVVE